MLFSSAPSGADAKLGSWGTVLLSPCDRRVSGASAWTVAASMVRLRPLSIPEQRATVLDTVRG